jgi:ureidoacrylate peracid hydrolase
MDEDRAKRDPAAALAHVPMLRTLARKVAPSHAALVVVDVQNDFCAPGGMMDNEGFDLSSVQEMARRLPELIEVARDAGVLTVFVRNVYSTEANAYLSDVWLEQASRRRGQSYTERDVCAEGSWEGDFYGSVRPLDGEPVVTKHRFSAFYNTDLDTVLRAHGIRTVVFTGVATNVCVETTAREAFVRDYYVVFLDDGTACYSDADHAATIRVIDRFFGQVATIADMIAVWGEREGTKSEGDGMNRGAIRRTSHHGGVTDLA